MKVIREVWQRMFVLIIITSFRNYNRLFQIYVLISTSRTVGSTKKFVRITSGFGGGEFTKTLRKVCT
jgi:hypothetical protein